MRLGSGAAIALPMMVAAGTAWAQNCPAPTPSISSSQLPVDVAPSPNNNCNPITLFDDFSWRSFVALVWPAAKGQRGVPDTSNTSFPNGVPLVFSTYKADWESFPNATSNPPSPIPTAWPDFAGPQNPCPGQVSNASWSDMILASDTKFGNLGLAGFGPYLVGPLIAQPGAPGSKPTYVRYQAAVNQTEYDQIFNNQWYLQKNIPASGITFCSNGATVNGKACPAQNSVDVKSSWIDMSGVPTNLQSRYYTRKAWVFDPAAPVGQGCSDLTVGLVGLHIVSKTPTRSAWIWSSFEQVDNVPPINAQPPFPQPYYNFHDQTNAGLPPVNPYCIYSEQNKKNCPPDPNPHNIQPMPVVAPAAFNVTRIMPISSSTEATNAQYQALLKNTPWQYYQLVMTQWPLNAPPDPNAHCGKVSVTFQGSPNATAGVCVTPSSSNAGFGSCDPTKPLGGGTCTSFANVSMETFDQAKIGTGCMNCHQGTGTATDFLWSLAALAWPPPSPPALAAAANVAASERTKSLNFLRDLLDSTPEANEGAIAARRNAAPKP